MSKRVKARAKLYPVLCRCVEDSLTIGLVHAYKHSETRPSDEELSRIAEHAEREILNLLCETLEFD